MRRDTLGAVNTMSMRWGRLYRGTPAELALEPAVAELGVPYRTQFPGFLFGFRFFPDFLLPTLRLVIEVDDRSHRTADKVESDAERTAQLAAFGWAVVRCTNEEAIFDPRGTVRRMLAQAGWAVERGRVVNPPGVPLHTCLPKAEKAPRKITREAKSAARRAARTARASLPRKPTRTG